jgi:hypothetical protein
MSTSILDGHRKILGHTQVALITIGDLKWISIANHVAIENSPSPSFWCVTMALPFT